MIVLEKYIPLEDKNKQWPQIVSILIASIGALNTGALFTWPSPSIPILISNASEIEIITIEEASYFSVIPPIASAITSIFIALVIDVIGRKKTVMFIAIPQFLSWTLIACAENVYVLYVSRILAGIAEATVFGSLPTYVAEIAEPNIRGSWGNCIAIALYGGQFMVNLIGKYCNVRTTAIIWACLPVIQIILALFLCESPYYLIMKQRIEEARKSLKTLRWSSNTEEELLLLQKDVERQISESGTYIELVTDPVNRKALWISTIIRGAQQLSGLSAFAVYTQYIFQQAGTQLHPSTCALIFTFVNLAANFAFAFVVDRFGRKFLMTFSCLGCFVMLVIVATYFYIGQQLGKDVSGFNWVPLTGLLLYIIVCASGLGIIPTLMLGELFSASIKANAMCVLNIVFSFYVLSVSKLYQALSTKYGMFVPFYLFAGCCFAGAVFSYFCVPETKGKTLEEIQQILKRGPSLRRKSRSGVC